MDHPAVAGLAWLLYRCVAALLAIQVTVLTLAVLWFAGRDGRAAAALPCRTRRAVCGRALGARRHTTLAGRIPDPGRRRGRTDPAGTP